MCACVCARLHVCVWEREQTSEMGVGVWYIGEEKNMYSQVRNMNCVLRSNSYRCSKGNNVFRSFISLRDAKILTLLNLFISQKKFKSLNLLSHKKILSMCVHLKETLIYFRFSLRMNFLSTYETTVVWKFHTLNYIPWCISHGKDYFGKCWNDLNIKMKFPDRANQHLIICHFQALRLHVFPYVIAMKCAKKCWKQDAL